jgi:hypothetical protein
MDGNAAWTCGRHGRGLCGTDQDKACDDHLILPGLMYGCEPNGYSENDDGSGSIEFVKEDGELFRHGRGKGEFSTDEMRKLPLSMLSEQSFVKHVKDVFGAKVESVSPDDILSRYPEEECEIVWEGATANLAAAWADLGNSEAFEPVAVVRDIEHEIAEFSLGDSFHEPSDIIVIKWLKTGNAEIRKGKM